MSKSLRREATPGKMLCTHRHRKPHKHLPAQGCTFLSVFKRRSLTLHTVFSGLLLSARASCISPVRFSTLGANQQGSESLCGLSLTCWFSESFQDIPAGSPLSPSGLQLQKTRAAGFPHSSSWACYCS